jgi:FtsP/CotA-like multicopper oxidase with cupredoxin domain
MTMNKRFRKQMCLAVLTLILSLSIPLAVVAYDIPGITGISPNPEFNLTTGTGTIVTGDGNSVHMWLYGQEAGIPQYPGPTIIVNQGDSVTINLTNNLPVPVSLVIPGINVTAAAVAPGIALPGILTKEIPPDNGATTVAYTFTASQPGTFVYHSGTNPPLQVEMGLLGAIIVRPTGFGAPPNRRAYGDADSAYNHENLFLLTDMDVRVHNAVRNGNLSDIDFSDYHDVYWFINGRTAPDTLALNAPWLKHQPYHSVARLNPGQTILYRVINASRDPHPWHTHGNHHRIIAKKAQFLSTAPGGAVGANLGEQAFTTAMYPGDTMDAIMTWTGENIGWDIYGVPDGITNTHTCTDSGNGFDAATHEWCADHGKPIPVILPNVQNLTFGPFYSGSPYLGAFGALPPGEAGFNANAGYFFMQHSHNEKELTNNNIFPGGMLTFLIVEPPSVPVE